MRILVAAAGIEDCRTSAWGVVAGGLRATGHDVIGFDSHEAVLRSVGKPPTAQIDWLLEESRPELLLHFPSGSELDADLVTKAAAAGLETRSLYLDEVSVASHGSESVPVGYFLPESSIPQPQRKQVDVLLVGDMTSPRQLIVDELLRANVTLRVYGRGWGEVPSYRRIATAPVSFAVFPAVLDAARLMVAWDSRGTADTLGPLHASMAAMGHGVPVAEIDGALHGCLAAEHAHALSTVDLSTQLTTLLSDRARLNAEVDQGRDAVKQRRGAYFWEKVAGRKAIAPVCVTNPVRVTYLTAAYNIEKYIGQALDSILAQTFEDIQVVVVVDGPTDGSASEVRRRESDPRVQVVYQSNVGQTGRFDWIFSSGLREARGEHIAILGGDDVALPDRTARCIDIFDQDKEVSVVHGGAFEIDATGLRKRPLFTPDFSYDSSTFMRRAIGCNPIADPTVMMRRDVLESVGGFTGGHACDYVNWMKIGRIGRMRYLPHALSEYRVHTSNSSIGAGAVNGLEQGRIISDQERNNSSLNELYPALAAMDSEDPFAWAAAYVDLGNTRLRYAPAPESALREFRRAVEVCGDSVPSIHLNIAAALTLSDRHVEASEATNRALARDPALVALVGSLPSAATISQKPFDLPDSVADGSIWWDGTPRLLQRILLLADWRHTETWWPVVDSFMRLFDARQEIELVLPSLGIEQSTLLTTLMDLLGDPERLEHAGAVTLEDWIDPAFIPMDRFIEVIDARGGLNLSATIARLRVVHSALQISHAVTEARRA